MGSDTISIEEAPVETETMLIFFGLSTLQNPASNATDLVTP
jgi:hypothetical protein